MFSSFEIKFDSNNLVYTSDFELDINSINTQVNNEHFNNQFFEILNCINLRELFSETRYQKLYKNNKRLFFSIVLETLHDLVKQKLKDEKITFIKESHKLKVDIVDFSAVDNLITLKTNNFKDLFYFKDSKK
jgi:hypothetical protein